MAETDADTPTVQIQHVAPPEHSRAAHRVHGWCSKCTGRELWEELAAWRARENREFDVRDTPDRVPSPKEVNPRG